MSHVGEGQGAASAAEQRLRAEVEELKRELERQKQLSRTGAGQSRPSGMTLVLLAVVAVILVVAGFFTGYLPYQRRETTLAAESKTAAQAPPNVTVVTVGRAAGKTELTLPGTVQAIAEAPVLARGTGYLAKRYVDIGDRVSAGQVLAEVEAPEQDQQVIQAKAALDQAQSAVQQTEANLNQARTNEKMARVTADRWNNLAGKGAVSRQENDVYQAQADSQRANVQAVEKAVAAARSNVGAAQANLTRLVEVQAYRKVRAPFAGVITMRNVDAGALVTEGQTLLFRIAQTDRLRIYISVPQSAASSVRVGQEATISVPESPGKRVAGRVTRTANALDPATRTLLTEVQAANANGALFPGTYAQVTLSTPRQEPPLLVRGDSLVVRSDGPQVAVVDENHLVHFRRVQLGRDFGDRLEVLSGLESGAQVIVNPGDSAREGIKVNTVVLPDKPAPTPAPEGGASKRSS